MDFETTVIGAGVVGLAIAAELAPKGGPVVVLERRARFGQETSSYNSEVLHAGLYYSAGSLKARLCLEGNVILRELGAAGHVPVKLTTKIVVGENSEESAIQALFDQATANGVEGLKLLRRKEIRDLEPHVSSSHALFSPHTGILDSHALMRYFLRTATEHGADLVCHTEVVAIEPLTGGYRLETRDSEGQHFSFETERVVNAAGLGAEKIARLAGIDTDAAGYTLHPCKGDYYSTRARCWKLVSRLVYPVPGAKDAGLGIHVTLDLTGRMRLGPDTTYLAPGEPFSYVADATKQQAFAAAVRRFLPEISEEDLAPEFAGIRPKLQGPGQPFRDFVITEESKRGLPGFVNLIGIESPGLTASPAIAKEVARLLDTRV